MGLAHTPESVFQPTTSILKRGIAHWLLRGAVLELTAVSIATVSFFSRRAPRVA
jgi:hypothetical protein